MTRKAITAPEKSSEKSSAPGRPFTAGDPRRMPGRGPAKGAPNAGRPPNSFRDFMRTLREAGDLRTAITTAARDPESRAFGHVLKLVSAYDEDGPERRVPVSDVRRRMKAQLRAIQQRETWNRDELLAVLDEVWA